MIETSGLPSHTNPQSRIPNPRFPVPSLMSLSIATLVPGLILLVLGVPLLLLNQGWVAALKAMPRSPAASFIFFGAATVWFLVNIWHLSEADFGDYRVPLLFAFAAIAALSFKCVPDFLAVRGLCVLVLLGAWPLLMAGYMVWDHPQVYFLKVLVYLGVLLAIWLGTQPWRLRDFFEWMFARPARTQRIGGILAAYGMLLAILAFTY